MTTTRLTKLAENMMCRRIAIITQLYGTRYRIIPAGGDIHFYYPISVTTGWRVLFWARHVGPSVVLSVRIGPSATMVRCTSS